MSTTSIATTHTDAPTSTDSLARSLAAGPPTETLELLADVLRAARDRAARRTASPARIGKARSSGSGYVP